MADALTFVERSSRHESIDESTIIVFQLPTSRESTRASYFGCADDCCNSVSYCRDRARARRDRGIPNRGRLPLQPQERPTEPRGQLRKAAPGANPTACPLPPPAPRLPERASPPACCCSK